MKLVFSLALALASIVGTSSVASAAIATSWYSTLPVSVDADHTATVNGATVGGSNANSSFGITISALGSTAVIGPGALTGTSVAGIAIDANGIGAVQIDSTDLYLDTIGGTLIIGALGANIATVLDGVKIDINLPMIPTTTDPDGHPNSGVFTIDNTTVGSLTLNGGVLSAIGVALGNPVNAVVDLAANPITVNFADLGASTISGTVNSDLTHDDTTDSGDEITLDWDGAASEFTIDLGGFPLTFQLTLQGGLSIGNIHTIPEPTSGLFLASLAAGVGAVVRRRRK